MISQNIGRISKPKGPFSLMSAQLRILNRPVALYATKSIQQPSPTHGPECSHRVWSRNGQRGCSDLPHDVIAQCSMYCAMFRVLYQEMGAVRITTWYPKFNGSHFWLAAQLYPQNDWTGWQYGVNDDVCTPAPSAQDYEKFCVTYPRMVSIAHGNICNPVVKVKLNLKTCRRKKTKEKT